MLGWSTTGGDLRVPHFVGLHALQAFLLLGAGGYAGVFALSLWQALRGQAVTRPDGWTLGALTVLVAGCAVAVVGSVRADRATPARRGHADVSATTTWSISSPRSPHAPPRERPQCPTTVRHPRKQVW